MTIETANQAAEGTAAPVDNRPPPKSDAEAALREAEGTATKAAKEPATAGNAAAPAANGEMPPPGEQKPDAKADDKKPNRTGEYIKRLQDENRRLRELATQGAPAHDARTPQQPHQARGAEDHDPEPTLEQFDYDSGQYHREYAKWAARQAQNEQRSNAEAASARESQQQMVDSYNERLAAFEADHPDFREAVTTIPYAISAEVAVAIMKNERGPEISYYIANNDDEAFALSNTLPHNAEVAVTRLIKRMDAAQQASQPEVAATPAAQAPAAAAPPAAKPISKAPAPTPTVGGRSVVEVPPEKQTDDDWYKADRERRRKR